MLLVGLTGGIGSGKSSVASRLATAGFDVIDADVIARDIVTVGSPVLTELARAFGDDIIAADGSLRRRELASRAFADAEARATLDRIMHPQIAARIAERVCVLADAGAKMIVVDHPLLIETGQHGMFDVLVVVLADEDVRAARLVSQRDLEPDDVRARMRAQTDDATRRDVADIIIENNGDESVLDTRVADLLKALEHRAASL